MARVLLALLGVAAAFAALVYGLDLGRTQGGSLRSALGMFAGVLALGLPLAYLCCKRGWWQVWVLAGLGATGGALATLPYAGGSYAFSFLVFTFSLAGLALGLLFWLAAIWRNDALTCPKSFCLPCGTAYQVARRLLHRRDLV
jgi:hypothetical protein